MGSFDLDYYPLGYCYFLFKVWKWLYWWPCLWETMWAMPLSRSERKWTFLRHLLQQRSKLCRAILWMSTWPYRFLFILSRYIGFPRPSNKPKSVININTTVFIQSRSLDLDHFLSQAHAVMPVHPVTMVTWSCQMPDARSVTATIILIPVTVTHAMF